MSGRTLAIVVAIAAGSVLAGPDVLAQAQPRASASLPGQSPLQPSGGVPTDPPAKVQAPADDLSAYQRFVIYPRLERGLDEQRRGRHEAAVSQFERARQLAPQSVLTALYLAYAYRQAGDREAARRVLEDQQQHSPADRALAAALAEDVPWQPPPLSAEEQERRARQERDHQLAVAEQRRRQDIEDRIAAVRQRIADARLDDASALAEATLPDDPAIRAALDRDLAQRAIHLRQWAPAQAAFERIDGSGQMSPADARQWLQIRLASGDTRGARALLDKPQLQGAENLLSVARVMQLRGEVEPLRLLVSHRWPRFETATQEAEWLQLAATALPDEPGLIAAHPARFAGNRNLQANLALPGLVAAGRLDEAEQLLGQIPGDQWLGLRLRLAAVRGDRAGAIGIARELVAERPGDLAVLDHASYQLVSMGARREAATLLVEAWPFEASSPVAPPLPAAAAPAPLEGHAVDATRRENLPENQGEAAAVDSLRFLLSDRLIGLAEQDQAVLSPQAREKLARPLAEPAWRERQAMLFAIYRDCQRIRELLGDFSPRYQPTSWIRLAHCYRDSAPGLAQYAHGEALAREPTPRNRMALAYQAHATQDYEAANAAWKGLDSSVLAPDQILAAAASAAAADDEAGLEAWLDRYDTAGHDARDDEYWWWRARLSSRRDPDRALLAVREAISIRPRASYYQFEGELLGRGGDHEGAREAFGKALTLAPGEPTLLGALALASAQAGHPDDAAEILRQVDAAQPDNPAVAQQLTWLYLRLDDREAARQKAREVIDDIDRHPEDRLGDDQLEQRQTFRRLHENLGRRWTFAADTWIGSQLSYAGRSADPGQAYRGYSQLEVDYRLATQSTSSDAGLSLFGRVTASSGADSGTWPVHEPTLGLGLRWKPLVDQVLYLTVEPLIPLNDRDRRESDVLVRASASFLNTGRYSDDWHPTGSGWLARSLYLDLGHYLRDQRTAFTADLRGSYHHKLGDGRSLEPYTHLQYSAVHHDGPAGFDKDLRIGLGLRLNRWSGESRYDAYPTRTSIGVEFQHAFRSFLDEREVILATLRGRW